MENLLHLFNTLWFERRSALKTHETTTLAFVVENEKVCDVDLGFRRLITHVRSASDQQVDLDSNITMLSDAESPKSVLGMKSKLETVVSGKEFKEEKVVTRGRGMRRKKGRRRSKSLTEMEFEEVKGFMDLGFVFTEEDCKDSSLVSMIPGLRRVGCGKREGDDGVCVKCGRKEKIVLRVGNGGGGVVDELEMKNQIKFWAHSVASAVR